MSYEDTRPINLLELEWTPEVGQALPDTSLCLEERCGSGGGGVVHRARDTQTGRTYAVKVLHPGRSSDLILNEAEILRQVHSPAVVHFEGLGMLPDGRPWMVMEFLRGRSLHRVLQERTVIDPYELVGWLQQVCRGLAEIHDKGWAHRDIKPGNLLLVEEDGVERIVIVDLGIAERLGAQPRDLSGTPDYIAPEQAQREPVDPRSDIYSLGCCAYELLTGRRPVSTSDVQSKIDTHVEGVRLTWPRSPSVPAVLRRIIVRCLAHDLEDRPASMEALEAELEAARRRLGRGGRSMEPVVTPVTPISRFTQTLMGHPGVAANDAATVDAIGPVHDTGPVTRLAG